MGGMASLVELKRWSINRDLYSATRIELDVTALAWLPEWYVRRRALALATPSMRSEPIPVPVLPLDSVVKRRRGRVNEWHFLYESQHRKMTLF